MTLATAFTQLCWLSPGLDELTGTGLAGFTEIGPDIEALRRARRPMLRACLDWTERRNHIAGGLGAALAAHALTNGWVKRHAGSRGLTVTLTGQRQLTILQECAGVGTDDAREPCVT